MVDPDRVIELVLDKKFGAFLSSVHRQHPPSNPDVINQPALFLDPGETTGVCEFDGDVTMRVYQKVTKDIGSSYDWLENKLIGGYDYGSVALKFQHMRYEDYRVYEWKAADHAWSPVHTIRWIGAIEVAAHKTSVPASCIMATHAKGFWTDEKLNLFDLNPKGLKHGRDALRHALYYLCFPPK